MIVDLNCDLGEGSEGDAELIPLVTSVNVACGFHAGDAATMFRTLELAQRFGVRVGAHPGHLDRANFGRVEIPRTMQQIFEESLYQVGALMAVAKGVGVTVDHLKPHGALYHQCGRDDQYAEPIVRICEMWNFTLVGLPNSRMQTLAENRCPFVAEGFADRRYLPDGTLVSRTSSDAFVHDPIEAVRQVRQLLQSQQVRTICVHGDNPQALEFVRSVRASLLEQGFTLRAFA